jgi:hypothetical protein
MFIDNTSDNTYYVNSVPLADPLALMIAQRHSLNPFLGQIATLVAVAEKHQRTGLSHRAEIRNQ